MTREDSVYKSGHEVKALEIPIPLSKMTELTFKLFGQKEEKKSKKSARSHGNL